MSAISGNLFSAALAFLLCFSLFTWLFVYKWPRKSLFWKKTDYFYYLLGVAGILLGLADSFRQEIQREISGVEMQLESDYRSLYIEVNSALSSCETYEHANRLQEQEADDERHGIKRWQDEPSTRGFLSEKEFTAFGGLPLYLTSDDCVVADALYHQVLSKQTPIAENLLSEWLPDIFRDPLMDNCDIHSKWARDICNLLRTTEALDAHGVGLANQYIKLNWVQKFSDYWKLLLALALGLRISKVYAEVKLEKNMHAPVIGGSHRTKERTLRIARIDIRHAFFSWYARNCKSLRMALKRCRDVWL